MVGATLQAVLQVGRPTVVDRCPTTVDKGFVAQKALSTAFITLKYFHTYDRIETLRTITHI